LTVDDLQKSITFYEALGFAIDERWEEKGTLFGVMLRAGKTQIVLNQDDWKRGRDRKKGIGVRLSISTTPGNVDEIAKRGQERRHHAQVGPSRHGVEEPRVRGQRFEVSCRGSVRTDRTRAPLSGCSGTQSYHNRHISLNACVARYCFSLNRSLSGYSRAWADDCPHYDRSEDDR
jgi:catechol 2,3-dioxygenase-like lactoylglutathione lyase family enzyme